ncbi:UDP-N-acetylmuramoyl-L-alanine--D-glutamate ligase [soil metagenome]
MRLLVFGSGVSGRGAARLAARLGHRVTVYDQEAIDPTDLLDVGAGLVAGAWDGALLEGVDLVVVSPGFSERSLPVVETLERGVPVWSEIEFAWRQIEHIPVIAVTGTNGKTTVTEAVASMLAASGLRAPAAGNIGTALSDIVAEPFDVAVVEVSSFQLRFIERFHPRAAALLNLAVDHLDWHGSPQAYAAAKARIFERQEPDDMLVFDCDDPGAVGAVARAPSRLHPVSGRHLPPGGSGVADGVIRFADHGLSVGGLPTRDPARLVDLVAAGVLSLELGAAPEAVTEVILTHENGSHRRTIIGSIGGVDFVDDSKATNPHAALAAIEAFPSVVLIAGGMAKGLDVSPLAAGSTVKAVVAIGESAHVLLATAGAKGHPASTMDEAVQTAHALARPGDTVLLAPGAASFDQYESYAARGEAFTDAFERLRGGEL